jgi:hypothetical protein
VTIDVTSWPADARKHELLRVLFEYAAKVKTLDIKKVTLSCKGCPKFIVDGVYFKEVGETFGVEHDFKLIRTFPEHVVDMSGKAPYEKIDAASLEEAKKQLGNFSKLIDAWIAQ